MKTKKLLLVLLLLVGSIGAMHAQTDYAFKINGTRITSANVNNLKSIEGVTVDADGYLKFDPATTTLSMKNVTLKNNNEEKCLGVESSSPSFTLRLEGENQFETPYYAVYTYQDLQITGSGRLSIKTAKSGIFVQENHTLTIANGCNIDIISEVKALSYAGIDALWGEENHLVIKNASLRVKATGTEDAPYPYAIGGFKSIQIEGAEISLPTNARVDNYTFTRGGNTYTQAFIMEGDKPAREVTIQKKKEESYGFLINGTPITSANADNLESIEGVTIGAGGYLKFDPATTTLSMKNVTLKNNNKKICLGVESSSPFTLRLEGENQFETTDVAVLTYQDLQITGPGRLSIKTTKSGIFVRESHTLTIADGCNIDIISETEYDGYAGITALWDEENHLVIKNASLHVKATGTEDDPFPYAIGGFKSIQIEGAEISLPTNARVDNYTFTWGGNTYTLAFIMEGDKPAREVTIQKKGAVGEIEEITLSLYPNPADRSVRVEGAQVGSTLALYSLDGVRLLTAQADEAGRAEFDLSALPAGHYIVKATNGPAYRLVVTR